MPQLESESSHELRPLENGFTLIEVLVVLVIMGLLAALISPRLRLGESASMRALAHGVEADLRLIRSEATKTGVSTRFIALAGSYDLQPSARKRSLSAGFAISVTAVGPRLVGGGNDQIAFFEDGSSTGGVLLIENGTLTTRIEIRGLDGRIVREP